jgi:hypothetical protein
VWKVWRATNHESRTAARAGSSVKEFDNIAFLICIIFLFIIRTTYAEQTTTCNYIQLVVCYGTVCGTLRAVLFR